MQQETQDGRSIEVLKRLYPDLGAEQLKEVESFWTRYLELALTAYDELQADPMRYGRYLALTRTQPGRTMNEQRSNQTPSTTE